MFYRSDTHAQSAAAVFSIIASCRLHSLDPEQYLDEVLRVLPYWPRERYLELAPKSWKATPPSSVRRARRAPLLVHYPRGVTSTCVPTGTDRCAVKDGVRGPRTLRCTA
jgi:hypothetical protein